MSTWVMLITLMMDYVTAGDRCQAGMRAGRLRVADPLVDTFRCLWLALPAVKLAYYNVYRVQTFTHIDRCCPCSETCDPFPN